MSERQSNAIATHTFPNLDSGYQENMGRNPAIFQVKIALTNNIYPNSTESWTPGVLFPNTFEDLLNLLLNTTTDKTFVHPVYGPITVQVQTWEYDINAKGPRDGVFLNCTLLETIGSVNPLSQQITTPPGSKLALSASALDNAVVNPPGLSLSGFFTQVQQAIGSIVSIPNNIVGSLNSQIISPVLNGGTAVVAAIYTAPATVYKNLQFQYQTTKSAVDGATVSSAVNTNLSYVQNFNTGVPASIGLAQFPQDASVQQVYKSFVALNSQPSQSGFQFINKALVACNSLETYYINQNLASLSAALEALRAYILQLQQTQSSLSFNANNQAIQVQTYVTTNIITWQMLARLLNNSVDQLMGLNQSLINNFSIPSQTGVMYYQSNNL
jgi:prophage DNA circulation protein